jgi:hypothetical protein
VAGELLEGPLGLSDVVGLGIKVNGQHRVAKTQSDSR